MLLWLLHFKILLLNFLLGFVNILLGLIVALSWNGQPVVINGATYSVNGGTGIIAGMFGGAALVLLLFMIWILTCVYSFYKYIRDRQYYLEKTGGAKTVQQA
ncbi:unnamed protein product, partial [Mesorhabditis belari]|uniref:Uncharacterized protein n=1 Tax=Mesorhabditis belari TaxID=2138241 RepID=A0AAF3F638_9BILA